MIEDQTTKTPKRRRAPTVFAALLAMLSIVAGGSTPVEGSVRIENYLRSEVETSLGARFYEYGTGATVGPTSAADFSGGTQSGTRVVAGQLTLDRYGDVGPLNTSWWDTDWKTRRCYTLTNPGVALSEYQLRLEVDTTDDVAKTWLQADGSDLRALADDDATELPLWIEGPMNSTATVIWVQVDAVPVGSSEICFYWNNAGQPSVSSAEAVFTYSTPQQNYYLVNYRFNGGGGANGRLHIVSYADSNKVKVDGTEIPLDAGDVGTWNNVSSTSVITSLGPIGGRGAGQAMDALVPASFAGTDFLFPTNRGTQRWTMQAPVGTADVEIYNGTALAWSGPVGTAPVVVTADVGGGRSGVIRSTNSVPILVSHSSTQGYDALTVVPYFGDDIYGVRSRYTQLGAFNAGTTVDVYRSDGTSVTETIGAGAIVQTFDSADGHGNGTAIRLTNMSGIVGALQQADRDGLESTSFVPERLLESTYYLPTAAQYIAFACPTPGTVINVGTTPVPCPSPGAGFPGHGITGATAAGTKISSQGGETFFAYYEDSATNDETNLFGVKAAQNEAIDPPTITAGQSEGFYFTSPDVGTWASVAYDTVAAGSWAFGLVDLVGIVPIGTTVEFRIASGTTAAAAGAAPFLGPDGTVATTYTADDPIASTLDGVDRYLRLQLILTTTDPLVSPLISSATAEHDLIEMLTNPSSLTITAPGPLQTDWLVRVHLPASLSTVDSNIEHLSNGGVGPTTDIAVVTNHPSTQIDIAAGLMIQPSGPLQPGVAEGIYSIGATSQNAAGSTVNGRWTARLSGSTSQLFVDHDFSFVFAP